MWRFCFGIRVSVSHTRFMRLTEEFANLFERDLERLIQELEAFPDEATLWETPPGISNSAGNLALHVEGNLREYIGRQLGAIAFTRQREQEFARKGVPAADLVAGLREVREVVTRTLLALSDTGLEDDYPEEKFGMRISTRQFVMHVHGHLMFHLGQAGYLRRFLMRGKAISFVELTKPEKE